MLTKLSIRAKLLAVVSLLLLSHATKEIARNMQEAAKFSTQVATNVTDVNKGAGETGPASTRVDKFLASMRAA